MSPFLHPSGALLQAETAQSWNGPTAAQAGSSSPSRSPATPQINYRHRHLKHLQPLTTGSCFWTGQKAKQFPGPELHGMARAPGAGRCAARHGHGAAATVSRRATALLRKSLARGAGAPGRTAVLFLPSPLSGWPRETGYGLGGSDSAHHATHGGEGAKSLAPGVSSRSRS